MVGEQWEHDGPKLDVDLQELLWRVHKLVVHRGNEWVSRQMLGMMEQEKAGTLKQTGDTRGKATGLGEAHSEDHSPKVLVVRDFQPEWRSPQ
ncbi:hypothetical protein NDU88_006280 [Pleurodeles waltl]|uniref:Uncharacterized protein n=1 Tax=Pleurodeles waltl TaxID=8319 RepID=A0AAV7RPG5_PLEWA|nr:hypothetical protein NDU88_006280 [Pleurodeles waltl]